MKVYRNSWNKWETLKQLNYKNKEGYVVLFEDGLRVKIKSDEYKRLHRIVTGVSTKSIWDCLRNNQNIHEYIYNVPDEFSNWVIAKRDELFQMYRGICEECQKEIDTNDFRNKSMKDVAFAIEKHPYKSVIFAMLREKDYTKIVWSLLEPEYEQPFKSNGETE